MLLPPSVGGIQAVSPSRNPTGYATGDFSITLNDPVPCTVGFLPPSSWRSPADTTDIDTPDGLYCKLPQDSPLLVRGARNDPCMDKPGKRAPTVEICQSDEPYRPLAMRQHSLGPYPFDPNLVGQGVPLDDRTTFQQNIFAPIEGTPLPPGVVTGPQAAPPPAPPGAGQPFAPQHDVPAPDTNTGPPDLVPRPGRAPATRSAARTRSGGQPRQFRAAGGARVLQRIRACRHDGPVRPAHGSLPHRRRSALSAVGSGRIVGAEDVAGHAPQVGWRVQPILTSLNGMLICSSLLIPHAPLARLFRLRRRRSSSRHQLAPTDPGRPARR